MKVTNKILENINNDVDTTSSSAFNTITKGIKFSINDEKEAYQGYNQFSADISEKVSEKTYNEINKIISHISYEEQEHIRELEALYKKLNKEINQN